MKRTITPALARKLWDGKRTGKAFITSIEHSDLVRADDGAVDQALFEVMTDEDIPYAHDGKDLEVIVIPDELIGFSIDVGEKTFP